MIKRFLNSIARLLHIKRRFFITSADGESVAVHISYAITVCNEAESLRRLLDCIIPYCRQGDEIIVQADSEHITEEVQQVIQNYQSKLTTFSEHALNYDFSQAKNHLNVLCHGDWIFQLDADECPQAWLMKHLQAILYVNKDAELVKIPRINQFVNEDGKLIESHVSWPDYQGRLYRNIPQRICWHRPLHEKIQGYKAYIYLPKEDCYAIRHIKEKKQDKAKWQSWKEHYA